MSFVRLNFSYRIASSSTQLVNEFRYCFHLFMHRISLVLITSWLYNEVYKKCIYRGESNTFCSKVTTNTSQLLLSLIEGLRQGKKKMTDRERFLLLKASDQNVSQLFRWKCKSQLFSDIPLKCFVLQTQNSYCTTFQSTANKILLCYSLATLQQPETKSFRCQCYSNKCFQLLIDKNIP